MSVGLLLIFGGAWSVTVPCVSGGDVTPPATTECYNPTLQQWELVPSLVFADTTLEKFAWSFGGVACVGGTGSRAVVCTNGSLSEWHSVSPLLYSRPGPTPIYGRGWVGIVGAMNISDLSWDITSLSGRNALSTINFSSWGLANTTYRNVSTGLAIPLNGSTCVVGGINSDNFGTSNGGSMCLDSQLNWLPGPSLIVARYAFTPLNLGGRICLAGGVNGFLSGSPNNTLHTQYLNSIECVDAQGSQFTQNQISLPTRTAYAANVTINDMPCLSGGLSQGGQAARVNFVICANATADALGGNITGWVPAPSLNLSRLWHTSWNIDVTATPSPTPFPELTVAGISWPLSCVTGGTESSTECWNATTSSWQLQPSLTVPMSVDGALNLGDIACLVGNGSVLCTNGSQTGWETLQGIPKSIQNTAGASFVYGGLWVGVIGGPQGNWTKSDLLYNPEITFSWMAQTSRFDWRQFGSVITINGTSCVIGGTMLGNPLASSLCLGYNELEYVWNPGPFLSTPRASATPIQDNGTWCLVGGWNSSGGFKDAECFLPGGGTKVIEQDEYVVGGTNISLYGMDCIAGGEANDGSPMSRVRCANTTQGLSWIVFPSLNIVRETPIAFTITPKPSANTPILDGPLPLAAGTWSCVVGGEGGEPTYNTECYNATASAWQVQPALTLYPYYTWDMTAFNLGSVVCLSGAYSTVLCTNGTGGWHKGPSLLTPRRGAASFYGNGWIGAVGGYSNFPDQNNPTWETTDVSPLGDGSNNVNFSWLVNSFEPRLWAVMLSLNGTSCMMGGGNFTPQSTTTTLKSSVCLRASNTWTTGPSLVTARYLTFSLQLPGLSCVGGGRNESSQLPTMECFDPQGNLKQVWATPKNFTVGASNISLHGMPCITGGRYGTTNYSNRVFCANISGDEYYGWLPMPPIITARAQHSSFVLVVNPPIGPPTQAPTVLGPGSIVVIVNPPTSRGGGDIEQVGSAPAPPPGQAVVRIVVELDGNQTATAQQVAQQILSALYLQLSLNNITADALGHSKVTVIVNNSTQGHPTYTIEIQTDEDVAHGITTILDDNNKNGGGLVGGYKISGVYVRWPSVTTLLASLPKWALILVLVLIGLIVLLLLLAHIRARNLKGLLDLSNIVFTVFSFILCVWFFTVLKSATTTKNNINYQSLSNASVTTVDGSVFIPYFIAFTVALFMTPILNAAVLLFQWKRVLRRDPDLRLWASAHPNFTTLILFLCLFSISNIFAITDPVLGGLTAPMAPHSRVVLSASGLLGGIFELPRLVVQFLLIGLYPSQNTAAAAWLPLSLGTLSFFFTLLQRCYALGYLRGTTKGEKEQLTLDGHRK